MELFRTDPCTTPSCRAAQYARGGTDLGGVADPGGTVGALDEELEEAVTAARRVGEGKEAGLFLRGVLANLYVLS